MVNKFIVDKKISDIEISDMEGEYINENYLDRVIEEDTDVFTDTGLLLLKFRKKVIPESICNDAINSFREYSKKKHDNRGASAGVLDKSKMPNYVGKFMNPGKFRTNFVSNTSGIRSKTTTSNLAQSNIAGFYDRADRNLKGRGAPCRLTAFNRDYPELWNKSIPFIKKCDELFKELVPDRYNKQKKRASETLDFIIENTAFSTLTLNYSWRTAIHKDAGDYHDGFGNLIVLEDNLNNNKYKGGYTCFPQYKIGVNVRQGDYLAMNVHEWHCNTELIPINKNIDGKWNKMDIDNLWYLNRLSVVCYLRNNMLKCKNMNNKKVQLLNNKSSIKDFLYTIIKEIEKPTNKQVYENTCNNLYIKIDFSKSHNGVLNYISYKFYYMDDFIDNDTVFISELNHFLNHSLNNDDKDVIKQIINYSIK